MISHHGDLASVLGADQDLFNLSARSIDTAVTLPPFCYTSEEFFELENRAIFDHEWLCVGRTAHVPNPGDYYTITIVDEPLLVVRGDDGEVRVLSAVCQHRGHLVAEGSGTCRAFQCPYHSWTYGQDGSLLSAPTMRNTAGFHRSEFPLPSLRTEFWEGFIFVNFDDSAPPLALQLGTVERFTTNFDLEHALSPPMELVADRSWNWKVQLENSNDAYHASRLHGASHRFCPSENAEFVAWADGDAGIIRTQRFTHENGAFNPTTKALMPVFRGLEEEERWRATFVLVPPLLTFGLSPDIVWYFLVLPHAANRTSFYIGYLLDPAADESPLFDLLYEQVSAGVKVFNREDLAARTSVQQGLGSRFARRSRYSYQEEPLAYLNQWLVKRYRRVLDSSFGSE